MKNKVYTKNYYFLLILLIPFSLLTILVILNSIPEILGKLPANILDIIDYFIWIFSLVFTVVALIVFKVKSRKL